MADVRAGQLSIEEIGKKHDVKPATIRTWKRRDKGAESAPVAEPSGEMAAFQMDPAQIPQDQLPDFGPADAPVPGDQPQPAAAPSPSPPPAAPNPADAILWTKLVSLASDGFQAVVAGEIGKTDGSKPTTPQPPDPISKEDQKELADALHAAFVAYGGNLAQFLAKWGPLINLAVVSGAIFLPRVMQARAYIKHQKEVQAEEKAQRARLAQQPTSALGQAIKTDEPETSLGDQFARRHAVNA